MHVVEHAHTRYYDVMQSRAPGAGGYYSRAALIPFCMQLLFEGGFYSRVASIRRNTVTFTSPKLTGIMVLQRKINALSSDMMQASLILLARVCFDRNLLRGGGEECTKVQQTVKAKRFIMASCACNNTSNKLKTLSSLQTRYAMLWKK